MKKEETKVFIEVKSTLPDTTEEINLLKKIQTDLKERINHIGSLSTKESIAREINQESVSFLIKHASFLKDYIDEYQYCLNDNKYFLNELFAIEAIDWHKKRIINILNQMTQEMENPFVSLKFL
jgi:predicted nucleotide-binding protein (sugar kinase/HSP70/actin superfamily)